MIGYFRKRKRVAWIVTLLMSVTILFGMSGTTVSAATGAVADDVTISHWHDSIAIDDTTKNIGRIWTDKSVSAGNIVMGKLDNSGTKTVEKNGDSDFLVGLSALSSAAKIMGQSTVPLDIVMVLDVSGSMEEDNKMSTLKTAVNSFIDETARTNSERSNENLRSRISLVKFAGDKTNEVGNDTYGWHDYNYTQVVRNYKAYTNDNKNELKNVVNALEPAGATSADYAMDHAKNLVNRSKSDEATNPNRKNVKRIVIFFTDGEPTYGSSFDSSVANSAIQTAKGIKADAKMYSIGVFKDADANNTKDKFNKYMHGMSSNYPDATAYNNLGTRATDSDGKPTAFYKAATQASELNHIFNEIQGEIIATAQSPTEVEGADPTQSGYVTLVDQLGDYMQVDDLNSLLYAENLYHYTKKNVTKEGNTTKVTYTFEAEIPNTNHVYPTGNLRDIKITVEKADAATALATGDKVTVKIPANLIPLRYYEVTKDNKITIDNTYPCRLFYDVSLKAAAEKKLERPDEAMEAYIAENSNEDGQVAFYANKYDKKSSNRDSEGIGAYANFTPASTNDFYYFQEDEILYTDEACTHPEKDSIDTSGDTTYYYQRQYYNRDASGNAVKKTNTVKVPGNSNLLLEGYAKKNTKTGEYYIPAGTPRTTSLTYFTENKADGANKSQTSNRVIKPVWENNYAGKTVYTHLGNNGKLVKELPGELDIRKSVQAAEGHQVPDSLKDSEFEYSLTFTGGTKEKYTAQKYTGADKEGDEFTVKSGDTFKLKDDQTLKIYGVDGGTRYTVTEAKPEHFTGSAAQRNAGEGSETGTNNDGGVYAKGTVAGKDAAVVDYTNIYQADSTTLKGSESLKIKKNFETASGASAWDMDYLKDAKFQFILSPLDNECPMPKDAAVADGMKVSRLNVNSKAEIEKAFGDIEYTKPGTYEYQITEKDPGDTAKQGVTYSSASYRVTVKVTDENGRLKANATMKKIRKDDGSEVANPTAVDNKTAAFTNVYDAKEQTVTLDAGKEFTDSTGTKTLKDGDYKFRLTPVTEGAPLPDGASGHVDASNIGNGVQFGSITFTAEHAKGATQEKPLTYEYKMKEILPEGATPSNHYTVDGLTYDNAEYKVRINVYIDDVDGQDTVVADYKYLDADGKELQTVPIFRNSYKADAVTLTGNTALAGEKTLTGRDGKDNEAFNFKLTPDAETQKAIEKKDVSIAENGDTASVKNLKNGEAKNFEFGNVTFQKEGVYRFDITEKVPGTPAGGMTYDRHAAKVTVTVTDDADHPGKLKAKVEYNNGTASDRTDKAVFKNKYESSLVYGATGALNIQKVLNGRTMKAGEFEFTYGPKDGQTAKITNPNQCGSGEPDTMNVLADLSFDQTMSGKTQTYIVRETKGSINGVTYDERIGTVEITPQDNGDGTMHVVTKVTMKNADGSGESVKTYDSSKQNSGTPTVRFTNTYAAAATDPVQVITGFSKKLTGREWKDGETFTFKLKNVSKPDGVETAPMPEKDEVTVRKADVKDGKAPIEFGALTFKKAGEYKYQLKEQVPSPEAAGMTYDKAVRDITVTVTDNGTGKLTAAVTAVSGNETFTNEYKTEDLQMDQVLGLSMTKVLTGRRMTEGEFSFTLKGADEASAKKLNIAEDGETVRGKDGADGETVTVRSGLNMTLKQADIGKTYAYTFEEVKGSAKGIVYDESQYKLEITAKDGGDGTLKAEVVLKDKSGKELFRKTVSKENPAMGEKGITLAFANRYDGSTDVSGGTKADINASKKLTGRKLKAGEFTFELMTKPGDGSEGTVLQTKKNGADGSIHFDALSYRTNEKAAGSGTVLKKAVEDGYATKTTKDGKVVYTVNYRVAESANNLPKGVTVTAGSFDLSVEVTDKNDGTLTAKTIYPKDSGDKCEFVNTYGNGKEVQVNVSGSKTLDAEEGLNPPDISGKFTFTLKALTEGAPMPKDTTVTNDGNGNVTFGTLAFNIKDLKDVDPADDGSREKTFKYSVTESGNVPGVKNDSKRTKEFELTLKDDGEGHLSVPETGNLFTFTNTYWVKELSSSVTDQIDITKKLDGRDLKDGEFKFRLMEDGKVISEAANDANGKVTFNKITYTKPGSHTYTVCEENDGKGGVIYDSNSYTVYTLVVDNGNGKLEATHRIDKEISGDQPAAKDITFANKYQAKPTEVSLGVTKRLNNAKLKSGQFTFVLKDANGEEVERAKNKAGGSVQFDAIPFEKAGTYEYTIEELNDKQKEITYDTKVHHVTITVTDDGEGSLKAVLTGDTAAVFINSYDNGDNGGGGNGKTPVVTPTGIQTGDYTSGFMGMVVLFLSACASLAVTLRKKRV
ncbi:MAG: FctA domain-containing protein [Clostridia bacterium]|nr:FctA domain-containing protein [Clostridia bacterium]